MPLQPWLCLNYSVRGVFLMLAINREQFKVKLMPNDNSAEISRFDVEIPATLYSRFERIAQYKDVTFTEAVRRALSLRSAIDDTKGDPTVAIPSPEEWSRPLSPEFRDELLILAELERGLNLDAAESEGFVNFVLVSALPGLLAEIEQRAAGAGLDRNDYILSAMRLYEVVERDLGLQS